MRTLMDSLTQAKSPVIDNQEGRVTTTRFPLSSLTVLAVVTYMLSRLVFHEKDRYGLFLLFLKTITPEFSVNLTS